MSLMKPESKPAAASVCGLIIGCILTGLLWRFASDTAERSQRSLFDQRVQNANLALERVIDDLSNSLQTIRATAERGDTMSQKQFEKLGRSLGQRLFSSGLHFVGLAVPVAGTQGGCDNTGIKAPCMTVSHVYPAATNAKVLGLDPARHEAQAGAMARAIDYGYIAFTPPLPASQENVSQPGLFAYVPVYRLSESLVSVAQRRRALMGVAIAAFSIEDMLRTALSGEFFDKLGVHIIDTGLAGSAEQSDLGLASFVLDGFSLVRGSNMQHGGHVSTRSDSSIRHQEKHEIAGRSWSYEFSEIPRLGFNADTTLPYISLAMGGLLTMLLTLYLQAISNAKRRAEALARTMTEDLRERERQLHQALDSAMMGSWQWDRVSGRFVCDERAHALLPTPIADGPLESFLSGLHKQDRHRVRTLLRNAAQSGRHFIAECRLAERRDGVLWIEISAQLSRNDEHEVARVSGLVRDVTKRIEAADNQRRLLNELITVEEKERRRIGRELHDQLGQDITAIALGLSNFEALDKMSDKRPVLMARLREIVDDIDTRVDKFMLDLRPVVLDDLGLDAALRTQFTQWSQLHDIKVNSHLTGIDDAGLSFEVATTVFRVIQESLTNVAKYAKATRVDVIVELSQGDIRVVIEDDGTGVDSDKQITGDSVQRYGLAGMAERVRSVGGEFRYESSPGQGFSVFARVPVDIQEYGITEQ